MIPPKDRFVLRHPRQRRISRAFDGLVRFFASLGMTRLVVTGALLLCSVRLVAQDYGNNKPPPMPEVAVPLTPAERASLHAVEMRIAGVEAQLARIDEASYKARVESDIRDFKRLLREEDATLTRNLAKQLMTYATGAPVRFSDRAEIDRIVDSMKAKNYGVRALVHAIVESPLFQNK